MKQKTMMRFYNCMRIFNICTDHFKIDLITHDRTRHYVYCRMVYYKLCEKYAADYSLSKSARIIGRTHATVIHSMNNWDDYYNQTWFTPYKTAYITLSAKCGSLIGRSINDELKCNQVKFQIQ